MSASFSDYLQHGVTIERDMQAHANNLAGRISAWALAGNGAGLLLCFNALTNRQVCVWTAVQPLAGLFLLGLVSAFASVAFVMRTNEIAAARMLKLNSAFRTAGIHLASVEKARELLPQASDATFAELKAVRDNAEAEVHRLIEEIQTTTKTDRWETWLSTASNWVLALSVASFGVAVSVAVWWGDLSAALCPPR